MRIHRRMALAAASAGLLAALAPSAAHATSWDDAIALVGDGTRLARFDKENPSGLKQMGRSIQGLDGDRKLVGIDRRVQNDRVYGVGDKGGIYALSGDRARKLGQLSVNLDGSQFGVDFNPAANALRIVSDRGQNLRQPFGTGDAPTGPTVADAALNTMGTATTGISGAAYTNNDLADTTATTLFDIDANLDQVVVQAPANAGSLSPTGKLGVAAAAEVGFDISSRLSRGATVSNTGFASLRVGSTTRLYRVELLTGKVTSIGRFPVRVNDIAIKG